MIRLRCTSQSIYLTFIVLALFICTWWLPNKINPHFYLDQWTAHSLQVPLRASYTWRSISAWGNADLFDALMYLGVIGVTFQAFYQIPKGIKLREISRFFIYYLLLSFAGYVFKHLLHSVWHYHRLSPSLSLTNALRIPQETISVYFKDSSRRSFPGDHALFLFSWALFWSWGYPRSIAIKALIVAAFFSFPRLLLGGHWLSDLTLGSFVPAWIFAQITLNNGPLKKQK